MTSQDFGPLDLVARVLVRLPAKSGAEGGRWAADVGDCDCSRSRWGMLRQNLMIQEKYLTSMSSWWRYNEIYGDIWRYGGFPTWEPHKHWCHETWQLSNAPGRASLLGFSSLVSQCSTDGMMIQNLWSSIYGKPKEDRQFLKAYHPLLSPLPSIKRYILGNYRYMVSPLLLYYRHR